MAKMQRWGVLCDKEVRELGRQGFSGVIHRDPGNGSRGEMEGEMVPHLLSPLLYAA